MVVTLSGPTTEPTSAADLDPAAGEVAPPDCSIARALGVIGDRWTILIMRDAFRGIRRFDDFRRDLDIARPVLADRLRKLVDAGVMVKRRYQTHPERFEYRLTPMGMELSPALVALMRWGDRWLNDGHPPTILVHEPCGSELEQGFWCRTCQQTFSPGDIASRHPHSDPHTDHDPDHDPATGATR
ncbi:MAG: helix-turn-helix transcriptional regulator [Microthrixaceae bacterium]|nr:helix-turn-helix transcriptional regulator [Microthrixaceae bacterium]